MVGQSRCLQVKDLFFKMWDSTNKATLYDMGKGVIFYVSSIAPTPVVGEAACHAGPGLPLNDVRTRPPFTCHQNSETVLFFNGTATPLLIFSDACKLEWYFCLEEGPDGVADQKDFKSRTQPLGKFLSFLAGYRAQEAMDSFAYPYGVGLTATTASPMAGYGRGHSFFLKMATVAEF